MALAAVGARRVLSRPHERRISGRSKGGEPLQQHAAIHHQRHPGLATHYIWNHSSRRVTSRNQTADELQVTAHIAFYRHRTVGFKLCPPVKSHVSQSIDHRSEIDCPFSKVMRVVLQMDLADALSAQPADLLH